MALKKTPARRKAPVKPVVARAVAQERVATGGSSPNRLLREAAWSRMFGRIESKNPFTR
jgi:hypothetical protein